ncbi:Metallopeptidase M24 family protein [Rhynchospora pubera]|uniref:Metallopeptidase M24 family protein n=1 Tax=Rhynchospora pubera TaxID=906938 RepID=A0AAV8DYN1_9POAL|nr:Metallopeptidase M24 family protein [Rhynchospora pubera]
MASRLLRLRSTSSTFQSLSLSSTLSSSIDRCFSSSSHSPPSSTTPEAQAYLTNLFDHVGQPTSATHPELMSPADITPGITAQEYIHRRARLLALLPPASVAIIASAPVKMMTDVVPYPFRQDADFFYLTGCTQPGGLALFTHHSGFCMFMPDPDPHEIVWQGQIAGVDAAIDFFKADQAFPLSLMPKLLPEMLKGATRVFHNPNTAPTSPYFKLDAFQKALANYQVKDISNYTHKLRWIKSPSEITLMRESASIACQSLIQTMLHSRTYPDESKLAAKVEFECKMRGAQRMAFSPVVGGGANGSTIHYSRNDKKIREGELVLMDIGCELHGYLSDLTRTWPPSGKFNPYQEELYSLILETNKECVELCKPGASIQEINNYSVKMLMKGLKELGILKGEMISSYHQLNPTSIGHYLGMDVHDSALLSTDRPLQPGVIITIEPGVYIPPSYDAPSRYCGMGIRIEDEVLITETGHEVLTASMPKEIPHLKALLKMSSDK